MSAQIRVFMGMKSNPLNVIDKSIDNLLMKIINGFEKNFEVNHLDYNNFDTFLRGIITKHSEFEYLIGWFNEKGFSLIQNIDCNLMSTDEIEDLIIYEEFMLDHTIELDDQDDFLFSITNSLKKLSSIALDFREESCCTDAISSYYPYRSAEFTTPSVGVKQEWNATSNSSSAPKKAELLLT